MDIIWYCQDLNIFDIMTTNPLWLEISNTPLLEQCIKDRHNWIARVFELKHCALIEDFYKHHILGHGLIKVHTIEFQK